MFKYLTPLLFSLAAIAQEEVGLTQEETGIHKYVPLKDNKVYDVEIIVFAYRNPLPNDKTYTNKTIVDDSAAVTLDFKPEELSYIETIILDEENSEGMIETTEEIPKDKPDFTVSIADEEDNKQALTWFNHVEEDYDLTAIWERLIKQPNIVPLVHRAWRQAETPFSNPSYVKLGNILINEESVEKREQNSHDFDQNNQYIKNTALLSNIVDQDVGQAIDTNNDANIESTINQVQNNTVIYSDFSLAGMVALSQGRFMHFDNQLNLFRIIQDKDTNTISNMVFSLDERRQLKTDELNYFDSPWMGSIVKITEYKGLETTEENNEETTNE